MHIPTIAVHAASHGVPLQPGVCGHGTSAWVHVCQQLTSVNRAGLVLLWIRSGAVTGTQVHTTGVPTRVVVWRAVVGPAPSKVRPAE